MFPLAHHQGRHQIPSDLIVHRRPCQHHWDLFQLFVQVHLKVRLHHHQLRNRPIRVEAVQTHALTME